MVKVDNLCSPFGQFFIKGFDDSTHLAGKGAAGQRARGGGQCTFNINNSIALLRSSGVKRARVACKLSTYNLSAKCLRGCLSNLSDIP